MGNKFSNSFGLLVTGFNLVQCSRLNTSRSALIQFYLWLSKNNRNLTSDPNVALPSYRRKTSCCLAIDLPVTRRSEFGNHQRSAWDEKRNLSQNFSSHFPFLRRPRMLQETHLQVFRRREVKPSPNPIWRNHRRAIHNVPFGSGYSTRICSEDKKENKYKRTHKLKTTKTVYGEVHPWFKYNWAVSV